MGGRKSHAELCPEIVAEAKRLRRASPKTGQRLSFREISDRLEDAGPQRARSAVQRAKRACHFLIETGEVDLPSGMVRRRCHERRDNYGLRFCE